jgi:hypothetical protein
MDNIVLRIDSFIKEIKEMYPKALIGYEFIEDEQYYDIWHNDFSIDINEDTSEKIGNLINEYFFDLGIYNISFGYDNKKSSKKEMEQLKKLIVNSDFVFDNKTNYSYKNNWDQNFYPSTYNQDCFNNEFDLGRAA